ncbi:MAG: hypothetical protein ABUK11_03205 [Mariprofundaceae bacterium]
MTEIKLPDMDIPEETHAKADCIYYGGGNRCLNGSNFLREHVNSKYCVPRLHEWLVEQYEHLDHVTAERLVIEIVGVKS